MSGRSLFKKGKVIIKHLDVTRYGEKDISLEAGEDE